MSLFANFIGGLLANARDDIHLQVSVKPKATAILTTQVHFHTREDRIQDKYSLVEDEGGPP